MKVRLADIADRAGVSAATVSRVLNGRPGVAEPTRASVLAAVDVLGVERPAHLRSTAGLAGLVVPELTNPVFPLFAQAIETTLARGGYTPVLCTQTLGGVVEDDYVTMLIERGVAGIVFVSGIHAIVDTDRTRYTRLRERGLPIVLVNGYLEGVDAPFVSTDDATGVDLAVAHLTGLGHRRIGLAMGPAFFTPAARKIAGFHAAVRRRVDDPQEAMVECRLFSIDGGAEAALALVDRGATALVCGSDLMALGAVRAVRGRGLRVPEDVSVIGSDDSILAAFTDPPLTTVRAPVQAMGEAAARALLDEIAGVPVPRAEFMFRPELVVRSSTAAAPDDPGSSAAHPAGSAECTC